MNQLRSLHTMPVGTVEMLAMPETDEVVSLDSPASEIFTDFAHSRPIVIEDYLTVTEARAFMRRAHVKLTLVVDNNNRFLGVLSYADLTGERFQQLIGRGIAQQDINVKDVMIHREELRAVAFEDLADASIGNVVQTLKQEHRQHFLVTDGQPKIRGIFSASDIARRLHIPVDVSQAPTFADICHVMSEHTKPH